MKSTVSSINSIKLVLSSPLFKSNLIKNIPELQDEEYSFSTFIYPHIEKEKWIRKPGSIVLVVFLCIFGLLLIVSGIGLFFFYLRRRDHEKLLIYSLDGEHKNIISDDLPESKSILETPKNMKGVKLSGYAFRKSMLNSSRPSVVTPQFSITSLEQKKMSPLDKNGRVKSINIERTRSKSGASFDVSGNVFNNQHDSKESPALFSLKESGSTSEDKQTLKLNKFDLNNESDFDLKKIIEKENIETEKDGKITNEIKYPNVIDEKEESLNNNNNEHENGEEMKVEEVKELNKERNEENEKEKVNEVINNEKEKENKENETGSEKQENDKDGEENEKKNDENVEKVKEEEREEEKINEKIVNKEDKESKDSDNNKNETKEEKDNTPEPYDKEPKNKNTDNNIIENISDEKEKTADNKLKLEENEINNLENIPESKEVIINEKNAEVNLENDVEILKEEKNDMILEDLDDISSPK